jgi:hypothetical protein
LEELDLMESTELQIIKLANCQQLKKLDLSYTQISDAKLEEFIKQLTNLE